MSNLESRIELSTTKKWVVVWAGILFTWNCNAGTSLPSGATDEIREYFSIDDDTLIVLLNSIFLVGYTIGPPVLGPMSEHFGRRPVIIGAYISYVLFSLACALSPRYWFLLLFRFLCGLAGSTPNAVIGGLYADIYDDPAQRGRIMAYYVAAATTGSPFGPIISGFSGHISWRVPFWIGLGLAGVGLPLVLLIPETYRPVLEKRPQASKNGGQNLASDLPASNPPEDRKGIVTTDHRTLFARPFTMMVREPVVSLTSLYLALVYSILYLFFQAYPIIFKGVYGLSSGIAGLAFLPVGFGSLFGLVLVLWYDSVRAKARIGGAAWAHKQEYDRLPLACVGGPAVVVALFWLGWTAKPSIHPAVPIMSGFSFGAGYLLIFIAMLNYMTDAYKQYSASAQSAASTTRSIAAICLPFAATPMYANLGVNWACSLLAFMFFAMTVVPFVFIRYNKSIQERSPFCQQIAGKN